MQPIAHGGMTRIAHAKNRAQVAHTSGILQQDARCWLTISLLPAPRETILATLRTNFWALRTLNNPEHMNTIRGLLREKEDELFLQDPHAFLRREQEALRRNSLFNAALKDDEVDVSLVNQARP
jgi:hypothetical protein